MAWTHLRRLEVYRGQSSPHETRIKIEKVQQPLRAAPAGLCFPCWVLTQNTGQTGVLCAELLGERGEETPKGKSACSSSQKSGVKPTDEVPNSHLKGIPARFCHKYFADCFLLTVFCPVMLLMSPGALPEEELRLILILLFLNSF